MKSQAKKFFLVIFIIILSVLLVGVFAGPYIVFYSLPSIVKEFYQRDLTIGSVKYNPFKATLRITDVSLNDGDKNLFALKSLYIDVSIHRTLLLNPTITSLRIEGPKTHILQYSSFDYRLPEYFKMPNSIQKRDTDKQIVLPKFLTGIKFAIMDIAVTDCNIDLIDKTVYPEKNVKLLRNAEFVLPGISSEQSQKLTPRVSGYILNKPFKIEGHSTMADGSLSNEFNINLDKFDIRDIAYIIPEICRVKLISGIISGNAQIKFTTSKHSRPELRLTAQAGVTGGSAYDMKLKKVLVERLAGTFRITDYDIFKNFLEFDYINVRSGTAYISLSNSPGSSSCIFTLPEDNGDEFRFALHRLDLKNVTLSINDVDRGQKIPMSFAALNIKDIYTYKKNPWQLSGQLSIKDICQHMSFAGSFSLHDTALDMSSLNVQRLSVMNVALIKSVLPQDMSFQLEQYSGAVSFAGNILKVSGNLELKQLGYTSQDMSFRLPELRITNADCQISSAMALLSFGRIALAGGRMTLGKKRSFSDINCTVSAKDMSFETKSKLISVRLYDDISLANLSCLYKNASDDINCSVGSLEIDKSLDCRIQDAVTASGAVRLHNAIFKTHQKVIASIGGAKIHVASYKSADNSLNFDKVELDMPKVTADIGKDGKLYLLSLIPLEFKPGDSEFHLNLDLAMITNGIISFTDYSLDKPFNIEISQLHGTLKNFPSFVYPQGELSLHGVINSRNKFNLDTKIGSLGVDGTIGTADLALSQLSAYFEKYIGYRVTRGNLTFNGKFLVKNNKLDSNFGLQIKDFGLSKTKSLFPADISKVIRLLEDTNGIIKLDIPVKGDYNNPNIDFRKIFFNLFYDMLDKSQSRMSVTSLNGTFVRDDTFEIMYFNAGSDKFTMTPTKFLSDKFKRNVSDRNKYYTVQAFVDKQADSYVLLQNKLSKMLVNIHGSVPSRGSSDEYRCLVKIYANLFGSSPAEDISGEVLRQNVLDAMTLEEADYQALSYARINAVKDILVKEYRIDKTHIIIDEENIYENSYISGIGNNIGIVLTGIIK